MRICAHVCMHSACTVYSTIRVLDVGLLYQSHAPKLFLVFVDFYKRELVAPSGTAFLIRGFPLGL